MSVALASARMASRQRNRGTPTADAVSVESLPSVAPMPSTDSVAASPSIDSAVEPVNLLPTPEASQIEEKDDVVVDLQARDSESDDEDDVDLEKLRARQAAIAARLAEEARQKVQRVLLMKNGVDAKHPEYMGFIPSDVINAILVLAK